MCVCLQSRQLVSCNVAPTYSHSPNPRSEMGASPTPFRNIGYFIAPIADDADDMPDLIEADSDDEGEEMQELDENVEQANIEQPLQPPLAQGDERMHRQQCIAHWMDLNKNVDNVMKARNSLSPHACWYAALCWCSVSDFELLRC